MAPPPLSSELIHASCVAIDGRAVLLAGRSGVGKSDLALRLIDRGARLVSDDYTLLVRAGVGLIARAPDRLAGQIEVRGIGIVAFEAVAEAPVALFADLEAVPERLPQPQMRRLAGIDVPLVAIVPGEPSAPLKIELALRQRAAAVP